MELGMAFMNPVLAGQREQSEKALLPGQIAAQAAGVRLQTAEAERMEMQTESDKKVAAAMAAQAASGEGSGVLSKGPAAQLQTFAQLYAAAGNPRMAAQYEMQASQIAARDAQARSAMANVNWKNFQMNAKSMRELIKMLGNVRSAEDWDAVNSNSEKLTGRQSPLKGVPYDPQLVDMLRQSAVTEYQRQLLAAKDRELKLKVADVTSKMDHRATQESIAQANLRLKEAREARLRKAGGKDIGGPSKMELEQAGRLIGDSLEGDEKDNAAYSIASEAKVIRRKNPAISSDEAIRQALIAAKQNGAFVPAQKSWIPFKSQPGKFDPEAVSKPAPLPASGKKSDLVEGKSYLNPKDGKAYTWTKNGWVAAKGRNQAAATPEDDSEDDDE